MPGFQNPIPDFNEAADAVKKIATLQADLFFLKQEVKTINQIKSAILIAISVVFFLMTLFISVYWFELGMHERGWSTTTLSVGTFIIFGLIASLIAFAAIKMKKKA